MSEAKYTKGPWMDSGTSIWNDFGCVCVIVNTKANAHLIAAAPELLEALKVMVSCMEQENPLAYEENMRIAREAIYKATGATK